MKKNAGRNKQGKITVRHQGGGNKRQVPHHRFQAQQGWTSPPRSLPSSTTPTARPIIALLHYADGEKRYILAPLGLNVGDTVISGANADIKPGNALPISDYPRRHLDPQPGDQARPAAARWSAPPA